MAGKGKSHAKEMIYAVRPNDNSESSSVDEEIDIAIIEEQHTLLNLYALAADKPLSIQEMGEGLGASTKELTFFKQ